MKKILFLAVCLFFACSVKAQYYSGPRSPYGQRHRHHRQDRFENDQKITVGFEAGLNISNTVDAYNSYFSTGTIAGFNAGITFDIPLVNNLSFAPEVLFSQKGFTAITDNGDFTQHSNFIDVPLLAKFKLAPGVNFSVGPQVSFLTSVNNTYGPNFQIDQNNYDYIGNRTFIDGVFGVSFDVTPMVDIHARYTIDLNPVDGNAYISPYRNQVWQFGLGFKLP
jgi:hypothetical protein